MRQEFRLTAAITLTLLLGLGAAAYASDTGDAGRAVVRRVDPYYPAIARQMRLGGIVTVLVTIGPDGSVSEAKVLTGHPLLQKAAADAVRQWKFAPSAAPTDKTISVTFEYH